MERILKNNVPPRNRREFPQCRAWGTEARAAMWKRRGWQYQLMRRARPSTESMMLKPLSSTSHRR